MSNLNFLLFGVYPFVALAVLVIGCWARFDLSQYTWRAGSSQLLHDRNFRIASILFHVGILFILAGHFVGLLIPEVIYHHVISTANKQLLAMVSGGIFGTMCLIGLLMLIHRRMFNPRVRATSSTSDILILWVLLAQLLLGLATIPASAGHMDGSIMVMLANWAQYTVTFQPVMAAAAIEPVSLVYKLHVFLGLSLFVLFPFTRLVHIVSAPVWYLGRRYQIVRLKATKPQPHPAGRPAAAYDTSARPTASGAPLAGSAALTGLGKRSVAEAPRQE
jgi:nitrate reductase gamma subunit